MIKLLTSIAGNSFSYAAGDTVKLDAKTEKRLIQSGQAEKAERQNQKPKNDH